ncbi:MAG: hypothetical protein GTO24_21250 [candidate division Zixibacteria bacterium]|nr:hypothetical protein [candidate division Zixibacteria bacterium]
MKWLEKLFNIEKKVYVHWFSPSLSITAIFESKEGDDTMVLPVLAWEVSLDTHEGTTFPEIEGMVPFQSALLVPVRDMKDEGWLFQDYSVE